jgi:hypothetical protein
MITIQDGEGNTDINATITAQKKQESCRHNWIFMSGNYTCPKCYSVTSHPE